MYVPFPKLMEFAEILTQICASNHILPQKNAAALPFEVPCHSATMSSGLQRTLPYNDFDALAPTTPKIDTIILKMGIKGNCHTCDPGFLANLEKSGMFTASVENPPVIEVMLEIQSQARVEPVTVLSCFQILGCPRAATAR